MGTFTLTPAKAADALRISVLLKTVYIQTYAVEGISFEFANFIEQRFSEAHIKTTIQQKPEQLIIASLNTNPIGVAEILFDSTCPVRDIAVPELSKLYILERFYGQGVGYRLIREAERLAASKGYKVLNLEVFINNARAISFYKRQGYEVIGTADFPMEHNTYKNLVMTKSLTSH